MEQESKKVQKPAKNKTSNHLGFLDGVQIIRTGNKKSPEKSVEYARKEFNKIERYFIEAGLNPATCVYEDKMGPLKDKRRANSMNGRGYKKEAGVNITIYNKLATKSIELQPRRVTFSKKISLGPVYNLPNDLHVKYDRLDPLDKSKKARIFLIKALHYLISKNVYAFIYGKRREKEDEEYRAYFCSWSDFLRNTSPNMFDKNHSEYIEEQYLDLTNFRADDKNATGTFNRISVRTINLDKFKMLPIPIVIETQIKPLLK